MLLILLLVRPINSDNNIISNKIDFLISYNVISSDNQTCQYKNEQYSFELNLNYNFTNNIPTNWGWVGYTTQTDINGNISKSYSLNKDTITESLLYIDALPYSFVFECISIKNIFDRISLILLINDEKDYYLENVDKINHPYNDILGKYNITTKWYELPIVFFNNVWTEEKINSNDSYLKLERLEILKGMSGSFNYNYIQNNETIDADFELSSFINMIYEKHELMSLKFEANINGYLFNQLISKSIVIEVQRKNYNVVYQEPIINPIEKVRVFSLTNKLLVSISIVFFVIFLIINKRLRNYSMKLYKKYY